MTKTSSDKPSYYAVIPAPIRYDESLVPNAKLLYGEITALANKKGYCWASNGHFAELYRVHQDTVSEWVAQLAKSGHIMVTQLKDGRRIHLTGSAKTPRGLGKNAEYNNKDSIKENKDIATPTAIATFDLKNEIKKLEDSPQRHLNIIAYYVVKKGLTPQSAGQLRTLIHRHARPAVALKEYTDKQITEAAKKASEFPEWTLETVIKVLTR